MQLIEKAKLTIEKCKLMRFHPRIPAFCNRQFILSLFQSRQTPYQYNYEGVIGGWHDPPYPPNQWTAHPVQLAAAQPCWSA
jgi:hypothetical protein